MPCCRCFVDTTAAAGVGGRLQLLQLRVESSSMLLQLLRHRWRLSMLVVDGGYCSCCVFNGGSCRTTTSFAGARSGDGAQ